MSNSNPRDKDARLEEERKAQEKIRFSEIIELERLRIARSIEGKKLLTHLQKEQQEAAFDATIIQAQDLSEQNRTRRIQEENLAAEFKKLKTEEIRELKMRQHLRENSHELKNLERQLKTAYAYKGLCTQIKEREATRQEEKIREEQIRAILEATRSTEAETEKLARMNEKEQKEKVRIILQTQMMENERFKQQKYQEHMEERIATEELAAQMRAEEQIEQEQKRIRNVTMLKEIEQYEKSRKEWKMQQRLALEEEDKALSEYQKNKVEKEDSKMIQVAKRIKEKEIMTDKMIRQIEEQKRVEDERTELLHRLAIAEKEHIEKEKDKMELEHEYKKRLALRESFHEMARAREDKLKEEAKMDHLFAQEMFQKYEEEGRLEQMSNERKRLKRIQIRKEIEEIMKYRREKRAEELKLIQITNELRGREEKMKQQLVEEERVKILKEHAGHVLGFLPKNCVQEEDLVALGISTNQQYPLKCACNQTVCVCGPYRALNN